MKKEISKQENRQVTDKFKWRDRKGNFHYPKGMKTRHLFFTLRMIWNHTMPLKFMPFKMYYFSDFYTPAYFAKAIYHLTVELMKRHDLEPIQVKTIELMIDYLKTEQIISDKPKVLH